MRQTIRFAQADLKGKTTLPGLCLPKVFQSESNTHVSAKRLCCDAQLNLFFHNSQGINPLLPIFREALLNGGADLKEQAAIGMGELISLSSPEALRPSVVHITGPLIRILGDRYGPNVKTAVLDTLSLLLSKV